jgi:hypothetical protein
MDRMNARAFLASIVLFAGAATPLMAQQPPPDGPPDIAEMRQRMMDRLKEFVGATDDEWKTLQPRIEKVQQLQRDAYPPRGGGVMMFGPGGAGGPGGPGGAGPGGGGFGAGPGGPPQVFGGPGGAGGQPSEVQQKVQDLREALDNKDTPAEELKAKAQAVRDARARAKADLASAQDDLKQAANPRQQAALLAMGVLE